MGGATGRPWWDLGRDVLRRAIAPVAEPRGSAAASLDAAMRSSFLLALAGFQVVMVLTVAGDPAIDERTWLAPAHAVALVLTLGAWRRVVPVLPVVVATDVLFLLDWTATPAMVAPLIFASCWMRNLSSAVPTFALRGTTALVTPLVATLALPPAMLLTRPDLPTLLPGSVVVTGLSILVATRVGVSYLRDFASSADSEAEIAEQEQRAVVARRSASQAAAEDARVLHDTVINTLAAVAAGGAAVRDLTAVRDRCADDVRALRSLQGGPEQTARPEAPVSVVRELPTVLGIRVRHTGLDGPALRRAESLVEPDRLEALRRAATELVQNAARHSGAAEVLVDVSQERDPDAGDALVVTVQDHGVGFDGRLREGRGLHRSVVARCETLGIAVDLSTSPHDGTTVRLVAPSRATPLPDPLRDPLLDQTSDADDFDRLLPTLLRRAGLLYAGLLVAVGFVLAATNHRGQPTPEYAMAALTGLVALAAWRTTRSERPLPGALVPVLVMVPAAAFALTAWSVDLGRDEPVVWQALGPTGPLVLLLVLLPTRRPALVSAGLVATTALALAGSVLGASPSAAAVVVIAAVVGLGLSAAWARFMSTVRTIGADASAAQRRAAAARVENAARAAAEQVRRRWRDAGIVDSVELLRGIGSAELDPLDDDVRSACAGEERYLRQLTLLDPDLVHLGEWLVRALGRARSRRVQLAVRAGDRDVDAPVAAAWGRFVVEVLGRLPAGAEATVSVFPVVDGTRLTLVAPAAYLARASERVGALASSTSTSSYGEVGVVTASVPRSLSA